MSRSRAWTERWTPRLSFFYVSSANHRSTRSSQDELVGVKWRCSYAVLLTVADWTPPAKYPLEKVAVPLMGFVVVVV